MNRTIIAVGAEGDGLARAADGQVSYIPSTLPGEEIGPDGTRLNDSPERVEPPCPHVDACGGCRLQHWSLSAQADWKRARVATALYRAGFDLPVTMAHQSPPHSRRRADFAIRRASDGSVMLGFHGPDGVVPVPECQVVRPEIMALLPGLATVLRSLTALRREGDAVINLLETGPDILLKLDGKPGVPDHERLAAYAGANGIARVATQHGVAAQVKPVRHHFAGAAVTPQPGAFLQATEGAEAAIVEAVLAGLPAKLPRGSVVIDLFAGLGTLSFPIAGRAQVQAFEGEPEAAAALIAGAKAAGGRVKGIRRDLARQPLLPAEVKTARAVVLDPPFAGAKEQVEQLARAKAPPLVYVSCNPAALERDARILAGAGYKAVSAVAIDQFLWSPHVEAVVVFVPPKVAR
ncbi:class I SAM-dependent RNA methyltransferase [Rhodovarius crocodyli]|uniref:Class I SAM-dependent RNA methyltransferase n=1 Tax=Rhodovarius crocodyli TaxID=1979269 RepID=A0A437MED2_9PROT|nr:RsmD family RNA methyltransferase [Rhodovarius crocodyli]RVT95965.1 class I SAM-dependent RNA methyltransferase [Rhodovarius crocodyli]